MSYDIEQSIDLKVTFALPDGTKIDPTEVHLQVKTPSGVVAHYKYTQSEITKTDVGMYQKTIIVNEHGDWWYRFAGTGTCQGTTGDVKVQTDPSQFPNI